MTYEELISMLTYVSKSSSVYDYIANVLFSNKTIEEFSNVKDLSSFLYNEQKEYEKAQSVFNQLGFLCQAYYYMDKLKSDYILPEDKEKDVKPFIDWISDDLATYIEVKDSSQLLSLIEFYKSLKTTFNAELIDYNVVPYYYDPFEMFFNYFENGKPINYSFEMFFNYFENGEPINYLRRTGDYVIDEWKDEDITWDKDITLMAEVYKLKKKEN